MSEERNMDFYLIKEAVSILANVFTRRTTEVKYMFLCPFCDYRYESSYEILAYQEGRAHLLKHFSEISLKFVRATKADWGIQLI